MKPIEFAPFTDAVRTPLPEPLKPLRGKQRARRWSEIGMALVTGGLIAFLSSTKAHAWESLAAASTGQMFDQSEQDERDQKEIRELNNSLKKHPKKVIPATPFVPLSATGHPGSAVRFASTRAPDKHVPVAVAAVAASIDEDDDGSSWASVDAPSRK